MRSGSGTTGIRDALSPVTAALPAGAEERPGQVEMAMAVYDAIARKRHLIVQAGTGTGKSLAYLVPSVVLGAKAVVATATKALQDQLAEKDLSVVESGLGRRIRSAVLKGRSNYLCRQKAAEVVGAGEQLRLGEADDTSPAPPAGALFSEVRRVLAWGERSSTGDRAELDFEPSPRAWELLSTTSAECPGALRCPAGEDCFAEAARRRADDAEVVVVNAHLYGAHLASGGAVLPDHEVVVFDEAHELEDVFAASLGTELGPGRLRNLARTTKAAVGQRGQAVADELVAAAGRLEDALAALVGRRVGLDGPEGQHLAGAVALAEARVLRATEALRASEQEPGSGTGTSSHSARARALQAAGRMATDLATVSALTDDQVAWVVTERRSPVLKVAPVEVGPLLAESLWKATTAVLTSATIPANLGGRLGLGPGEAHRLDVGSPFPYETNGLLYCAAHLPDRRRQESVQPAIEELRLLIEAAGGRTLALFTSWKSMREAADALRPRTTYRILSQSELPKPALIAAFTEDESSCLFATMGFWQGVDVPGPTLTLVVIDRIPFPRPDEPLMMARRERAGPAAFSQVDLPRAAAMMAQGAGRLIRAAGDRGVVAVLDPRLARASYRWDLVRAMPPMARTRDLSDVQAFLLAARDGLSNRGARGPSDDAASPDRP